MPKFSVFRRHYWILSADFLFLTFWVELFRLYFLIVDGLSDLLMLNDACLGLVDSHVVCCFLPW